jgi:branched-subunit amino acid ABC-type transport system permease component
MRVKTRHDISCIPPPTLLSQVLLGLVNDAFHAMFSLGLALIFGLLDMINMAHGALYMMSST